MNPNGLSTGVVRVEDATIAVNNKAQKSTDAISSFKETLPSSQHVTPCETRLAPHPTIAHQPAITKHDV